MKRPDFIARQSGHPKGLLGRLIAKIMADETAPENDFALDLLNLQPDDRFLDIGTGHGATLNKAAAKTASGLAVGIDPSRVMVRHAKRRVSAFVRRGSAQVHLAKADAIPFPDESFNKLLSVHTIYFWDDLLTPFEEIFRVCEPGAIFVLCFRPGEDPTFAENFPDNVYRIRLKRTVLKDVEAAGFVLARVIDGPEIENRGHMVFAVAEKPGCAP